MKSVLASATACVILLAAGCSQSPEKLLETANKYHANKKYDEASILYQKILVKDKTNAEAYYRLGLNALDQAKLGEALQALRRAVDLKPANTDAETKLAEINLFAYRSNPKKNKSYLNDAKDLDAKMLQQDSNSFDGLRIQGLIALADQDVPKALDSFAKANKVKPYSRDLAGNYAQTLIVAGKPDDAVALLKDTIAHDKTWGQGYDLLVGQYLRTNQRDKAEEVLRQHVAAEPTNASAITVYANYKVITGDFAGGERLMQGMVNDPKSFPTARLMLGDFYERSNKPDQALAAYQEGVKEDSKEAVKYQERIVALQAATNHGDQALSMAKDLVDKNPKDASASQLYAQVLLQTTNRASLGKTIEEVRKLVDNHPTDTLLRFDLARAYFDANERDKALAAAQQSITDEQKTGHPRPGVVLPAQILVARVYGDRVGPGDKQKALDLANTVLSSKPGDVDAMLVKDRALIGLNQADKAQPELEALVARYPKLGEAHLQLGNVYMSQKQFDKASAQFQAASTSTPPDPRGLLGMQTVKLFSGHSTEAIQGMQDLLAKNPADPSVRLELANFQATAASMPANQANAKQLMQQAADNYKEILKAHTNAVDVWLRLGQVQQVLGQSNEALASYEQASTTDPKNSFALLNEGILLDRMNRKKEAIDMYNKVLTMEPDNALALNNLAYLSAETGANLDQAQTYAERAKKKAPESADVADTLGFVYLQKNLNKQAADIFQQNVASHPDNAAFRFHLAMALLKQGDKQGAKQQAGKALQSANPDLQNKIKAFVGQIG